jgi:hypothetical protein
VFVELMRRPEGRTLVMDVLPASVPWVRYLPAHEMRRFSVELVETLGAAAELDNSAAVAGEAAEIPLPVHPNGLDVRGVHVGPEAHPVTQSARVDAQVPGDLRDRLPGLPDQPDRALAESVSNFLRVPAIAVLL